MFMNFTGLSRLQVFFHGGGFIGVQLLLSADPSHHLWLYFDCLLACISRLDYVFCFWTMATGLLQDSAMILL